MKVFVYAHMYMFTTLHNSFMLFATSLTYLSLVFSVIVNRHGRHNIRNGIVWVHRDHSTSTCTVSLHVVELGTHQKVESFKKNFRDDENRIRIC